MSAELHKAIIEAARNVRDVFDSNDMSYMTLSVKVTGRIHDELKIEYTICSQYDADVKGADLITVLDEYMRRRGWDKRNAPLALPAPERVPMNDGEEVDA